jgi:hypothetical protein
MDRILTEKALRNKEREIAAAAAAAAAENALADASNATVALPRKASSDYTVNSTWVEHDTLCGNAQCFTCGRAEEGAGALTLECGDAMSIISNITAVLFGAAADQPDWTFTRTAELCDSPAGPCTHSSHCVPEFRRGHRPARFLKLLPVEKLRERYYL